ILTREGMRASELATLKWRDVDLERGRVRLDENKTDDPRAWALAPDVVRTLAWWKKRHAGEANDLVLGLDLHEASCGRSSSSARPRGCRSGSTTSARPSSRCRWPTARASSEETTAPAISRV